MNIAKIPEVYNLCVNSDLRNHTAICITCFPNSHQVFGLYLRFESEEDVANIVSRLAKNRDHPTNPFVLIIAFLEIEKRHRLHQVNDMVNELQGIDWAAEQNSPRRKPVTLEEGQKQHEFHDLNIRFGILRSQLTIWTTQLKKLLRACDSLPKRHQILMEVSQWIPTTISQRQEKHLKRVLWGAIMSCKPRHSRFRRLVQPSTPSGFSLTVASQVSLAGASFLSNILGSPV